jgi:hypothetical protein
VNDAGSRTLIAVDELARLMDAREAVVLLHVIDEQGGRQPIGRKYRVPFLSIWPRTFPARPHRPPAGGLCPM